MPRRITTRIEEWFEEAIDKYGLADKDSITWDLQLAITQQGPQIAIIAFMPSGIFGMLVSSFTLIENPAMITQEEVDGLAKGAIEALREARSEALTEPVEGISV